MKCAECWMSVELWLPVPRSQFALLVLRARHPLLLVLFWCLLGRRGEGSNCSCWRFYCAEYLVKVFDLGIW